MLIFFVPDSECSVSVVTGWPMLWDGGKERVAGYGPHGRLVRASHHDGAYFPTLLPQVQSNQSCHDQHHLQHLHALNQTL